MSDNIDKMIAIMRGCTPAGHAVHTADYADLRMAVTHCVDMVQMHGGIPEHWR